MPPGSPPLPMARQDILNAWDNLIEAIARYYNSGGEHAQEITPAIQDVIVCHGAYAATCRLHSEPYFELSAILFTEIVPEWYPAFPVDEEDPFEVAAPGYFVWNPYPDYRLN